MTAETPPFSLYYRFFILCPSFLPESWAHTQRKSGMLFKKRVMRCHFRAIQNWFILKRCFCKFLKYVFCRLWVSLWKEFFFELRIYHRPSRNTTRNVVVCTPSHLVNWNLSPIHFTPSHHSGRRCAFNSLHWPFRFRCQFACSKIYDTMYCLYSKTFFIFYLKFSSMNSYMNSSFKCLIYVRIHSHMLFSLSLVWWGASAILIHIKRINRININGSMYGTNVHMYVCVHSTHTVHAHTQCICMHTTSNYSCDLSKYSNSPKITLHIK